MTEFIQISTNVDSKETAIKIARKLLNERLTSCVQVVGPISSDYWWKGRIERAREWICLIKARASHYSRIQAAIKRLHPYEVPEVLAFRVHGHGDYLRWIEKETRLKPKAVATRS